MDKCKQWVKEQAQEKRQKGPTTIEIEFALTRAPGIYSASQPMVESVCALLQDVERTSEATLEILYGEVRVVVRDISTFERLLPHAGSRSLSSDQKVLCCLLSEALRSPSRVQVLQKTRLDHFDTVPGVRARQSRERVLGPQDIQDTLDRAQLDHHVSVSYRPKNRRSYSPAPGIRVDVTAVNVNRKGAIIGTLIDLHQGSNRLSRTSSSGGTRAQVEIELETDTEDLVLIQKWLNRLVSAAHGTTSTFTAAEETHFLKQYAEFFGEEGSRLHTMHPVSATRRNLKAVSRFYAVAGKTDGETAALLVATGLDKAVTTVLFDSNMHPIPGPPIDPAAGSSRTAQQYVGTLLHGEYLRMTDEKPVGDTVVGTQGRLFLAFDAIRVGAEDVRDKPLAERLAQAEQVCRTLYRYELAPSSAPVQHPKQAMQEFYKYARERLLAPKGGWTVLPKRMLFPDTEGVFATMARVWELEQEEEIPWSLDGIILTPPGPFTHKGKSTDPSIIKWKPPALNSIDCYVRIGPEAFYGEQGSDAPYRVATLYVGNKVKRAEVPVEFEPLKGLNTANLLLDADHVLRAQDGTRIETETVLEMVYTPDSDRNPADCWTVLRTRYDKTLRVMRERRGYGNYKSVAQSILNAVLDPVRYEDFLNWDAAPPRPDPPQPEGGPLQPDGAVRPNGYYQHQSKLAGPMRAEHNRIKEKLLKRYAAGKEVLDLGCGRGGDVGKYHRAGSTRVVLVDPDATGFEGSDGVHARVASLRKSGTTFVPLVANPSRSLARQVAPQLSKLGHGKKLGTFDLVHLGFSVHYNAGSAKLMGALLRNFTATTHPGSQVVMTVFDGERVAALLDQHGGDWVAYRRDPNHERVPLFRIQRHYKKGMDKKWGARIGVTNAIFRTEPEPEYLVPPTLLRALMEKHGFKHVESKAFPDLRDAKAVQAERASLGSTSHNAGLLKRYNQILQFYDPDEASEEMVSSRLFSSLFTTHVFQRV